MTLVLIIQRLHSSPQVLRSLTVEHCNRLRAHFISIKQNQKLIFVPLSVSLWNDLSDPVFDGVGLAGFKSRANAFLSAWSGLSLLTPTILSFSSFHGLVLWGWGLWTECSHSLQALHSRLQMIIILKSFGFEWWPWQQVIFQSHLWPDKNKVPFVSDGTYS